MPTKSKIIEAMTFPFVHDLNPINTTGQPRERITFKFDNRTPADNFGNDKTWQSWNNSHKDIVLKALNHIETFLNVDFVEVSGNSDPDLSLGRAEFSGREAGLGGLRTLYTTAGDVVEYDGFALFDTSIDLRQHINLVLHELGHALGLDHPFDNVTVPDAYDNNHYSVMSYTRDPVSGEYNDAMMLYDVLALQQIWGKASYKGGNSTYTGSRTDNVDVVWDTGGNDTFDASRIGHGVKLDLREGHFSRFGSYDDVAIAYGVKIENATGSYHGDRIYGNSGDNSVRGKGGSDYIKGYWGNDVLRGGTGSDQVRGGSGRDYVAGGEGNDWLFGGPSNDTLVGAKGVDKLWGGKGADTFKFLTTSDRDYIRDFQPGVDKIQIVGRGDLDDVLDAARTVDGHTRFYFDDGDMLTVRNVTLNEIRDDILV